MDCSSHLILIVVAYSLHNNSFLRRLVQFKLYCLAGFLIENIFHYFLLSIVSCLVHSSKPFIIMRNGFGFLMAYK